MIEIIKSVGADPERNAKLQRILNRGIGLNDEILARVDAIIGDVRGRGDAALIEFTARFDGVKLSPKTLRVDRRTIEELAAQVDDDLIAAMREAIANIRYYHEHQLTHDWRSGARTTCDWASGCAHLKSSGCMFRAAARRILRR